MVKSFKIGVIVMAKKKKKTNRQNGFIATAVLYSLVVLTSTVLFINVRNLATTREVEKDTASGAKDKLLYYTIVYNGNGSTSGSMEKTRMSAYRLEALAENKFQRTGYTFYGWALTSDGAKKYDDRQMVNLISDHITGVGEEYTLYANYQANTYKVTFNSNGGNAANPANKDVKYDSPYGDMPSPTKTGYTFAGWYTAASGGTKVETTTTVKTASAHTLYAHWTANKYRVTLNANGGSVSPNTRDVTYDSTYGTLPNATRAGYTFKGWFTATSGGSQVTSGTKVTITAAQTLYARWQANSYKVTFNSNGGSTPNPTSKNVTYDSTYGTLPTVSRTGYTFKGWFTATSGGSQVNTGTTVKITGAQTLYARWQANSYKVTFNSNGGNAANPASKNVTYDSTYGALPSPTRNGFKFLGWFTAASGGSQVTTGTKVKITGAQTLYAHWKTDYLVLYNGAKGINLLGAQNLWKTARASGKNTGTFTITDQYIQAKGKYKDGNGGSIQAWSPLFNTQGYKYIYLITNGRSYSTGLQLKKSVKGSTAASADIFSGGTSSASRKLYWTSIYSGVTQASLYLYAYSDEAGSGNVKVYKVVLSNTSNLSQTTVETY